jgi:hypothetical protein
MAKTKISEFDSTPANNTDIDSINIAEGCAPSGINNAIRELMSQLKDQQTGASGDNFTVGGNLAVTGNSTFTGTTTVIGSSTAASFSGAGTGLTGTASSLSIGGNAATVTNGVYTTGTQTIAGAKTFSSTITGDISGNSGTVTNGVYTTNFTSTNQSLASSGYQKLPGGVIIQWGTSSSVSAGSSVSVSFPISFPSAVGSIQLTAIDPSPDNAISAPQITSPTTSSFSVVNKDPDSAYTVYWFAVGY